MSRLTRRTRKLARTAGAMARGEPVLAFWWNGANFGDAMNPLLIEALSGRRAVLCTSVFNVWRAPVYSVVGSVLDILPPTDAVVWGSGFVKADATFDRPKGAGRRFATDLRAVRGPLTRARALELGVACPAVYGDPALLLPRFHATPVAPVHALGLVPHFVDAADPVITGLQQQPGVHTIDVRRPVYDVVDAIRSCRAVASTSLHGLIVAIAYGIPALWIEVSDRVWGAGFKFRDFFQSIGADVQEAYRPDLRTTADDLIGRATLHPVNLDLEALLAACPFRRPASSATPNAR